MPVRTSHGGEKTKALLSKKENMTSATECSVNAVVNSEAP